MTLRLLALDLDGTTFGEDLVIRPAVIAAVGGLVDRGIQVVVATGRSYASALPFVRTLGTAAPVICYQGAVIRDQALADPIASWPIDADLAGDIVRYGVGQGDTLMVLIGDDTRSNQRSAEARFYESLHPGTTVRYDESLASFGTGQVIKILVVTPPNGANAAIDRYRRQIGDRGEVMRSHPRFAEITARGVSKGLALRTLADRLGVPRSGIVAIGDQANDLPLFEAAGIRIAMGNADDALKARADHVAPTVQEDGVAWAITELFGLSD